MRAMKDTKRLVTNLLVLLQSSACLLFVSETNSARRIQTPSSETKIHPTLQAHDLSPKLC